MGGEASVVCITSVPTQTGDQREGMCLQQGVEREKKGKEKSHTSHITQSMLLVESNIGHASVVPHHMFTTSCKQAIQGQP